MKTDYFSVRSAESMVRIQLKHLEGIRTVVRIQLKHLEGIRTVQSVYKFKTPKNA
jgi:hypothetical protein